MIISFYASLPHIARTLSRRFGFMQIAADYIKARKMRDKSTSQKAVHCSWNVDSCTVHTPRATCVSGCRWCLFFFSSSPRCYRSAVQWSIFIYSAQLKQTLDVHEASIAGRKMSKKCVQTKCVAMCFTVICCILFMLLEHNDLNSLTSSVIGFVW